MSERDPGNASATTTTRWRLVLALSGFGAAMGIATVYLIPPGVEPAFWLAIFLFSAVVPARRCEHGHFLHGLALGFVNQIWVTAAHLLLVDAYLAHQPVPIRTMMLMGAPVVGAIFGIALGLLSVVAARVLRGRARAGG